MSTYTILIPLAFTLAPQYDITNAAILGCLYLAPGIGNITATRFTGTYADYVLRKYANGVYCPEHRLYAALIGSGFILPVSVLAVGWVRLSFSPSFSLSLYPPPSTSLVLSSFLCPIAPRVRAID